MGGRVYRLIREDGEWLRTGTEKRKTMTSASMFELEIDMDAWFATLMAKNGMSLRPRAEYPAI